MTRIKLDPSRRETRTALKVPSKFHGAIEHAFPEKQERNLWRTDKLGRDTYLLMVSPSIPDMESFSDQFCRPGEKAETKDYVPHLNRMTEGTEWYFRLRANPTHQPKSMGKRLAHVTPRQQEEWLRKVSASHGFEVTDCRVTGYEWNKFDHKDDGKVSIKFVDFEGLCRVTDAGKFRKALTHGIGHAKAFGSGMLTVIRCSA